MDNLEYNYSYVNKLVAMRIIKIIILNINYDIGNNSDYSL